MSRLASTVHVAPAAYQAVGTSRWARSERNLDPRGGAS